MPLTPEQRKYVVQSVVRILKDVNRDEIIGALKHEVLLAEAEGDQAADLDKVVLAVAEACRQRLKLKTAQTRD